MKARVQDRLLHFLREIGNPQFFVDDMLILDVVEFDDGHGGAEEGYVEFLIKEDGKMRVPGGELRSPMRGRITGKVQVRLR